MNAQQLSDVELGELLAQITREALARGLYSPSYVGRALGIAANVVRNAALKGAGFTYAGAQA